MIAVTILAIALVASLALISKSVQSAVLSQNRLTASYLAYEGADLIRNIRDNNWENPNYPILVPWTDGWSDCNNCEIDYTVNALSDVGDPYLKIDDNDLYNYTNGVNTIFKRRISVSTVSGRERNISVSVVWNYRGIDYSEDIVGVLYNWR